MCYCNLNILCCLFKYTVNTDSFFFFFFPNKNTNDQINIFIDSFFDDIKLRLFLFGSRFEKNFPPIQSILIELSMNSPFHHQ